MNRIIPKVNILGSPIPANLFRVTLFLNCRLQRFSMEAEADAICSVSMSSPTYRPLSLTGLSDELMWSTLPLAPLR